MRITSSPAPYSTAVEPLLFTLDDLDPEVVTTVEIVNAANGTNFGTMRLTGLDRRSIDIAPYLRRHFGLGVTTNSATYIVPVAFSVISCYIRVGDVESEILHALLNAPAHSPAKPNTLLSDNPLKRTIAPGENDDLYVLSPSGTLAANISLIDVNGVVTPYTMSTTEIELMVSLILDFDTLQKRVAAPLQQIDVEISTLDGKVTTLHYDVVKRAKESYRVAWANSRGGADLYTFEGVSRREVEFLRTENGTDYHLCTSQRTLLTLDSGVLSKGDMEAVLSILSSPAVWVIVDGRKRQAKVETKSHVTNGTDAPTRLTVQFSWIDTIMKTS